MSANNTNELSKEQIEYIKNYGNKIVTLDKMVDQIRQTKGMYIGEIGEVGILTMFREILQNSIDEVCRPLSPCNTIWVTFDQTNCSFTIEDNGTGIPFGNIIRIYSDRHTSSNFTKQKGKYTSGLNGVGAKIVNALSSKFIVESYVLGEARRVEFDDCVPWKYGEKVIPNKENRQGTKVYFQPAFAELGFEKGAIPQITYNDVLYLLKMLTPLTPKGTKMYFKALLPNGSEFNDVVECTDGIIMHLYDITKNPLLIPIAFEADDGERKAEIVMTYDLENTVINEQYISFSNFCITSPESVHVTGFIEGVTTFFRKYMNDIYLNKGGADKKKNKLVVSAPDIRTGLRAVINAAHLYPNFTGQAKEKLSNKDMVPFIKELVMNSLDEWSKNNPSELQKLCKYFKEIAEIRSKNDKEKIKLSDQYRSTVTGYPTKFKNATKSQDELFIVEGDSAGGSFGNYRDHHYQAVFPIRGKIKNCTMNSEKDCLKNEEVAGILKIVGKADNNYNGYGKKCDTSKVPWKKIIFAGDADSAGKHINALLLRLFIRFFPELIAEGRVYKVVPPLYMTKIGKNIHYFSNRIEFVKYVQKEFSKKNEIFTLKGKKLSTAEVTDLLYRNIDYIYELRKISDRYHVEEKLLELYLYCRNMKREQFIKEVKKHYRFVDIKTIHGMTAIEGIINLKNNALFLTPRLEEECKTIIDILESNPCWEFKMNGEIVTLYDIMHAYENSQPSGVTRLKGLGEQSGDELKDSVIKPDSRTLIRYTLEDAKREIEEIRAYDTNKSKLLTHIGNINRFDLME